MAIAAVGQLCSTASMAHNLRQCQTLVRKAVASKASALFLPEASDWISSGPEESLSLVKSVKDSEFVRGIQAEAKASRLPIYVGVHEPTESGEKVKNTLLWVDERGEITQRYQKLHMFDMDVTEGPKMSESKTVEKGQSILPPFQTSLGAVGSMICFDLRFPELALSLRRQGAQLMAYPSAFTPETGKIHWEILLRARAIETQSYVIAAAQVGAHNSKRSSYGHSMIVDPWGKILAELGGELADEPEITTAEIDLEYLDRIRREVHLVRRTDVYGEV